MIILSVRRRALVEQWVLCCLIFLFYSQRGICYECITCSWSQNLKTCASTGSSTTCQRPCSTTFLYTGTAELTCTSCNNYVRYEQFYTCTERIKCQQCSTVFLYALRGGKLEPDARFSYLMKGCANQECNEFSCQIQDTNYAKCQLCCSNDLCNEKTDVNFIQSEYSTFVKSLYTTEAPSPITKRPPSPFVTAVEDRPISTTASATTKAMPATQPAELPVTKPRMDDATTSRAMKETAPKVGGSSMQSDPTSLPESTDENKATKNESVAMTTGNNGTAKLSLGFFTFVRTLVLGFLIPRCIFLVA